MSSLLHDLGLRLGNSLRSSWSDPPFDVAVINKESLLDAARYLRENRGFNVLMDLTVVDYQGYKSAEKEARFEIVIHLAALETGGRVRLKAPVPADDPAVPSLTPLYKIADWFEREAWDMYGIRFRGHPDPRRILMYEEFSGHPLRKDYPLKKQQPRVKQVFEGVPPFGGKPGLLGGGG